MSIAAHDESIHTQGRDKYWNESFYLNFFDDKGEWGGVTRVGLSPNQSQTDGLMCLYFPDGGVGVAHGISPRAAHVDEITGGDLRHERLEPLRRWKVQYSGALYRFADPSEITEHMLRDPLDAPKSDVEIDLEFTGYHEPFDYHMRQGPLPLRKTLRDSNPGDLIRGVLPKPLAFLIQPNDQDGQLLRVAALGGSLDLKGKPRQALA